MSDEAKRVSIAQIAEDEGFDNVYELLEHYAMEDVVPAVCSEYCMVEPDGVCPHGFKSILLARGLI